VPVHRAASNRLLVVKDAQSLCGGSFANRTEAIGRAMYKCQRRSQSGIMLPDGLELDGPLDEEQGNDPAKRRAGVTNVARASCLWMEAARPEWLGRQCLAENQKQN
jgi:hypothetical protein